MQFRGVGKQIKRNRVPQPTDAFFHHPIRRKDSVPNRCKLIWPTPKIDDANSLRQKEFRRDLTELEAFFQRKEFISSFLRLVSNSGLKLPLRNLPIEGDQDIANVEDSRLNSHQARLNSYSGNG